MRTVGLVIVSEPFRRRELLRLRRPLSLMMEDLILDMELRMELRAKEPGREGGLREGGLREGGGRVEGGGEGGREG